MSISTQIDRINDEVAIQANKMSDILAALEGKSGGSIQKVPLDVTDNGTYTAPTGKAYTPVNVAVPASKVDAGTIDITENGNVSVVGYANANVNVPTGGGKVVQCSPVVAQVKNKTAYTATGASITVEETGNYKCSWIHFAYAAGSTSTYATQLYRSGSAVGSAHASPVYSGTTNFVAVENSIQLTKGQTIEVRARTRSGSSYYTVAGMLVIEKI